MKDPNLKFIRQGKTGCLFASVLAKDPKKVGWRRVFNPESIDIQKDDYILSLVFPHSTQQEVIDWAIKNGMYLEKTSDNTVGLRYKVGNNIAWVQYFGADSHVPTRQTPQPELLLCVKVAKNFYHKVGFTGILHLAHGSIEYIKKHKLDKMWDQCYKATRKFVGHKLGIDEASKTTFKI
jgi:hypothetical protein